MKVTGKTLDLSKAKMREPLLPAPLRQDGAFQEENAPYGAKRIAEDRKHKLWFCVIRQNRRSYYSSKSKAVVRNMDKQAFKKSATFIAKRNVSERVLKVVASVNPELKFMCIVYYTKEIPNGDDWADCELTCAELIAEFPEIENAETHCATCENLETGESVNDIVFLR